MTAHRVGDLQHPSRGARIGDAERRPRSSRSTYSSRSTRRGWTTSGSSADPTAVHRNSDLSPVVTKALASSEHPPPSQQDFFWYPSSAVNGSYDKCESHWRTPFSARRSVSKEESVGVRPNVHPRNGLSRDTGCGDRSTGGWSSSGVHRLFRQLHSPTVVQHKLPRTPTVSSGQRAASAGPTSPRWI